VPDDPLPVQWSGRQAIVTLPEQIDASNADLVREELLAAINRGATELVADMSATVSCDYGGANALVRAYQRGAVSGTQLRLVVAAPIVRRILEVNGLDRLISIYPDLESATAAGTPGVVLPLIPRPNRPAGNSQRRRSRDAGPTRRQPSGAGQQGWPGAPALSPAVLGNLVDALSDGVVLVDDDGVIVLANRRLEEMFGYQHGELSGRSVESLVPAHGLASAAGRVAQGRGHSPGRDQLEPGADPDRLLHPRRGPRHHRTPRTSGPRRTGPSGRRRRAGAPDQRAAGPGHQQPLSCRPQPAGRRRPAP
jgi:anti-sigma B factor antagonist